MLNVREAGSSKIVVRECWELGRGGKFTLYLWGLSIFTFSPSCFVEMKGQFVRFSEEKSGFFKIKIPKFLNIVQNNQNIFMDYIQPKDCTSAWAPGFNLWPGSCVFSTWSIKFMCVPYTFRWDETDYYVYSECKCANVHVCLCSKLKLTSCSI